MLLLHVEALGSLRKELMRTIGTEQTRRVLKRAGYEVVGLFMKNWEDDDTSEYCSSREDLVDAVAVAEKIGIEIDVVTKDGRVQGFASGESDTATHRKMEPADLMLAGSTGKTLFAAVALQLIDSGKLELDAPISKYLGTRPWFSRLPNAKDVTVRQLMTHTSGIIRYEFNDKFTTDLIGRENDVDVEDILDVIFREFCVGK